MTSETKAPLPDEVENAIDELVYGYDLVIPELHHIGSADECASIIRAHIKQLKAELEIYRRNDAGGCYSNRTEKETY